MTARQLAVAAVREAHYLVQRVTGIGIDVGLEREIAAAARRHLDGGRPSRRRVGRVHLDALPLEDAARFTIARHDGYRRFEPLADGSEVDHFGRAGRWVPRGTTVYRERTTGSYVKIFDHHCATRGEARYLGTALDAGLYDFLCPGLEYVVHDDGGVVRGYAVRRGAPLSRRAFERYVGVALRELVLVETARTGLYFYDLAHHNVILSGRRLSFIDLESVLPIDWYGTDDAYTIAHRDELDVGWSLQSKWNSPDWYGAFLTSLTRRTPARHSHAR